MPEPEPHSGRCAIVGKPNVGKSTLLNRVLGQKLAIATPKPQTTRTCILGVYASQDPPRQIAFVDTPGLHRPHNALGRALVEDAKGGIMEADVVLLVTALHKNAGIDDLLGSEEMTLLDSLRDGGRPVVLAINKIDRLPSREALLPLLQQAQERFDFAGIVPISALGGDNVGGLIEAIARELAPGLQFDPELLTDRPERFFAAELVREAVIRRTRQEVPYAVAVTIDEYVEEPKLTRIVATIVVEREGHKGIVIGKGGARLKEIGTRAREEIEALIERKVFLKLWVKVAEGWTDDPRRVQELTGREEAVPLGTPAPPAPEQEG